MRTETERPVTTHGAEPESDAALAASLAGWMATYQHPEDAVRFSVLNGIVSVVGRVASDREADAIRRHLLCLPGVRHVNDWTSR